MTLGDRLGFRSFELIVRPDLGADIDGYRLRLRQTLGERLAELGETDVGAIVDLGKVPAPKVRRVSISH
nr:hypothetical protein [Bdellovibrionales bacterium]